jgi:hypothetical protein
MELEGKDWVRLCENSDRREALWNKGEKFLFPWYTDNLLSKRIASTFSRTVLEVDIQSNKRQFFSHIVTKNCEKPQSDSAKKARQV